MSPSWPDSSGFCGGFTTPSVAQAWGRGGAPPAGALALELLVEVFRGAVAGGGLERGAVHRELHAPLLAAFEDVECGVEVGAALGQHLGGALLVREDRADAERDDRPGLERALEHGLVLAGHALEPVEVVQ